jgi:hypothetical protein
MKHPQHIAGYIFTIFALILSGCVYPNSVGSRATATATEAQVVVLPEQPTASLTPIPATPIPATPIPNTPLPPTTIPTATYRPTNTPAPLPPNSQTKTNTPLPQTAPTYTNTPLPHAAPSNTPIAALPTSTTKTPVSTSSYSAVLVKPDDVLNVRQSPNSTSPIVGSYPYSATNVALTGKQSLVGNIRWDEVTLPGGKLGWINDVYVTETIPVASFCADNRVTALISQLSEALIAQDGVKFAGLINPKHGLYVQDLRGGTVVDYTPNKARWLFESTYVANWGNHPGSGLPVKGTFSQEVLPNLLDVLTASYTKNCENIAVGGTTYTAVWPKTYQNINFYSLYRPGSPGKEMDWRTWLVGIEYVNGQPYLFALYQLVWEP